MKTIRKTKTKPKLIAISGTPAVGKTTLAKLLVKQLNFQRLDLHQYYKQISTKYNHKKQCYDIDLKKFEQLVKEKIKETEQKEKKGLIVDTHIAHLLPKQMVDLCIILTCSDLKKLKQRLTKRKYNKKKVAENLEAEIFQVCLEEARQKKHNLLVFDNQKKINFKNLINKVKKNL